jgi:hypothetical protein
MRPQIKKFNNKLVLGLLAYLTVACVNSETYNLNYRSFTPSGVVVDDQLVLKKSKNKEGIRFKYMFSEVENDTIHKEVLYSDLQSYALIDNVKSPFITEIECLKKGEVFKVKKYEFDISGVHDVKSFYFLNPKYGVLLIIDETNNFYSTYSVNSTTDFLISCIREKELRL